jgi:hypothetical protein
LTLACTKICTAATKPLSEGGTHDLNLEDSKTFLASLGEHIVESGWEAIFSTPEDATAPVLHMITTNNGIIAMAQVNTHVQTFTNNDNPTTRTHFPS